MALLHGEHGVAEIEDFSVSPVKPGERPILPTEKLDALRGNIGAVMTVARRDRSGATLTAEGGQFAGDLPAALVVG